ncbi:MAG: hypothetical protein Kilf2KO_31810 [Rhodospirillales bacterium]
METDFTPWAALAGGAMIGAAAVLLMALSGRVLGATGTLAGALFAEEPGERAWRLVLLLGMVSGPLAYLALTGGLPMIEVPVPPALLAVGGLLVGLGVSFANGCTSGHGVCGLARLSRRSLVATVIFMVATAATVFILRHLVMG